MSFSPRLPMARPKVRRRGVILAPHTRRGFIFAHEAAMAGVGQGRDARLWSIATLLVLQASVTEIDYFAFWGPSI
jgi:hypothetical protein